MGKKILKVLVVIIALVGGFIGYQYYGNYVRANVHIEGEEVFVFIPKDATAETVMSLLESKNILTDASSLVKMMSLKNYQGKNIVPGKYKLTDGMSNNTLINHLRAGNGRLDSRVQFNNVQTIQKLAGKITEELLLDSAEVESYLSNPINMKKYGFDENTMLSMFIPNTYFMHVDVSMEGLMERMGKEYKLFWNEDRRSKLKRCGMTQSEVVTLASIVYWETKLKADMPIVAGVYMNRLRDGWPLQADPTLIYVYEKMGKGTLKRVLNIHKELDSPYNTYKFKGLPPGPILVPPPVYVDAVLNYQKHNYYFFVAKESLNGESYFSKTYSQHKIYAARYYRMLKEKGIR